MRIGKEGQSLVVSGAHLVSLVHSGEYTLEVAELFGVGRSTVYRAIQRQRQRLAAKAELVDASTRR